MIDKAKFFEQIRESHLFGATLDQSEVDGLESVLEAVEDLPISWQAYAIATAYHETARTMLPVREAYWLSENWRKRNLRYYPWYGRGYVQLTWDTNYHKADKKLAEAGLIAAGDLIHNPDLAMDQKNSAHILRYGMVEGWFAKSKDGRPHTLARHIPHNNGSRENYENARRIINGIDKAASIATYALQFQDILSNC